MDFSHSPVFSCDPYGPIWPMVTAVPKICDSEMGCCFYKAGTGIQEMTTPPLHNKLKFYISM